MANATLTLDNGRQYEMVATIAFDYTNVADTAVAVEAIKLPINSVVTGGYLIVDTAWDTGTTATLKVGDTSDDDRYTSSAINLKSAAATALTITGYKNTGGLNINILPALAGTATTAGAARLIVKYVISGRAMENQPN